MPISWLGMEKQNLTQRKHAFTTKTMYFNTTQTQKLKPGLVASYDIWPGNGEGLFWFRHFINFLSLILTYLDTYPLTYSPELQSLDYNLTFYLIFH